MIVSPKNVKVWIVKGTTYRSVKDPDDYRMSRLEEVGIWTMCLARTAAQAALMFAAHYGDSSTIKSVETGEQPDAILTEGEQ